MKPREELKDVVWDTVTSILPLKDKAERIVQHTDQLAIGRWVSVEERLPEEQGFFRIQWSDGLDDPELNHSWFCIGNPDARTEERKQSMFTSMRQGANITHWLELDLPNEKGER